MMPRVARPRRVLVDLSRDSARTAALAVLAAACGDPVYAIGAPVGAGASSSGDSESGAAIDRPDRDPPPIDDEESDDGGMHEGPGFIMDPDGGGLSYECDLWAQDCPAGKKCNIWGNDGGSYWNARRCTPIDPDPDAPGEPCTVVESRVSGIDSCELGAVCWNVDPELLTGTCVAFCQGSEANPLCEDPTTHCEGREFALCLPSCCPLEQLCPEGTACYPTNHEFTCAPDASGELGAFRDPCEFLNVCDPGLFCADVEAVPDCEGSVGCCTEYCAVGSTSCAELDPALACVPWFEEGEAPPGYEHTGVCVLEQ